jgi:hypothetical protein
MAVSLKAQERDADVVVRKGKYDYHIYPISDAALRWLKGHSPHARWNRIDGQQTMTVSHADATRLVSDIRKNDFRLRGRFS